MMNFIWALCASITVSIISLIGVFSLFINEKLLNRILLLLVGFSAGALIGGAFLHLLPKALEKSTDFVMTFVYLIFGFVLFFVLEKYLYWRHCHKGQCEIHTFTYMNLIGDGIHNFIDGLIIGAAFLTDVEIGMVVTVAIIMHEIPQELGDFGVLLYGGFSKFKALAFNFLSATTAIFGTAIGYMFASRVTGFSTVLFPFAAGGFIYIAACDLIPEIHRQPDIKKAASSMVFFIFGILLMFSLKLLHN